MKKSVKRIILESNKKTKNKNIQAVLLETVKTVGIISLALIAPNATKLFKDFFPSDKKRQYDHYLKSSVAKLVEKKLIAFKVNKQGSKYIVLTEKGEQILQKYQLQNFKLKKPKKWDNKWRIVIFDISEVRKNLRDQLRSTLSLIGFIMVQKSVWVYPYSCDELVSLIKANFSLGKEVLYITADSIENDSLLRNVFSLK